MSHFLLVYRRSTGELVTRELGLDAGAALEERFASELAHKDDPDVEVVLLSAPDLEALRRTHSRYFRTITQLAGDINAHSTEMTSAS